MINDIFNDLEQGLESSLCAVDGTLWKKGTNVPYAVKKVQEAVNKIEGRAQKWGFRISSAKIQVLCFTKTEKCSY